MHPETALPAHSPSVGQWQQLLSEHGLLDKAHATFPPGNNPLPQSSPEKIRAIQHALQHTRGDRTVAAQLLGIGRTTLYRKLKEYRLD